MAAAAEAAGGGSSRHEKSLGLLTTKFVSLLQEAKDGVLDLKAVHAERMLPDSLLVPSDRRRRNGHKLKHKKFHCNFSTLRVAEHRNRLPREVVVSPSLETFKTHLDEFLCTCCRRPCLYGRWTK